MLLLICEIYLKNIKLKERRKVLDIENITHANKKILHHNLCFTPFFRTCLVERK